MPEAGVIHFIGAGPGAPETVEPRTDRPGAEPDPGRQLAPGGAAPQRKDQPEHDAG